MNTSDLIKTIGESAGMFVACKPSGYASLHRRFIVADPCYIFKGENHSEWDAFLRSYYATKPKNDEQAANEWQSERRKAWHPMEFKGHLMLVRDTGGDGSGFFGVSTDSGTNAVIPIAALPPEIIAALKEAGMTVTEREEDPAIIAQN